MTVGVISYDTLKQNSLALTSWFETTTSAPATFGVTSGNFDGQGMSHGALQFNMGQGTLQPIWKDLINNNPDVCQSAITSASDYAYWKDLILNGTQSAQVDFGNSITDFTADSTGHKIKEPWNTYFKNLGVSQVSIDRQKVAAEWYYDQAEKWKPLLMVWSRRGYALLFDIAVQKGSFPQGCIDQCISDFQALNTTGMTREQIEAKHLEIIANRRTDYGDISSVALSAFRQRKLAVAQGSGTVYGMAFDTVPYDAILEPAYGSDVMVASGSSIMVGTVLINNVMVGLKQVDKIYLGSSLVWEHVVKGYRYVRVSYPDTENNPYEINVLAGTVQAQVGHTITFNVNPLYGTPASLINGILTDGAYWDATKGTAPWIGTLDLGSVRTDLTKIELWYAYDHKTATVEVSTDGVTYTACTFNSLSGHTQIFNLPA